MTFVIGINTNMIQAGLEAHTKINAHVPVNVIATVQMKEKSIKAEIPPCKEETNLFTVRYVIALIFLCSLVECFQIKWNIGLGILPLTNSLSNWSDQCSLLNLNERTCTKDLLENMFYFLCS